MELEAADSQTAPEGSSPEGRQCAPGAPLARVCLRCLRGPEDEEARMPLDAGAAPPLAPQLTARFLGPIDRLFEKGSHARGSTPVEDFADDGGRSPSPRRAEAEAAQAVAEESQTARRRRWAQGAYVAASTLILCVCYYYHQFAAVDDQGYTPLAFTCGSYISKYTTKFGQSLCGPGWKGCMQSDDWLTVRCDGWCALQHTDPVGRPVIGSGPFRPDSRVCPAAVHAGLVGTTGGCVRVRAGGPALGFVGSESHGVTSLSFSSIFPLTLELAAADGAQHCDYGGWWGILLLNIALLLGLTLLRPQRQLCFWCVVVAFFWYCTLGRMTALDMDSVMQSLGLFSLFVLAARVLLWEVGGARLFFPDTALGAPLEVLLLEVVPVLPFLHIQMLGYAFGDYDLNGALLEAQDRAGLVVYGVGIVLLMPAVAVVMWGWYKAGALGRFLGRVLGGAMLAVALTLLFSTENYGLHLHHYFVGLLGFLGARGSTRTAAVLRALSLGAFINGLALWGEPTGIPIWSYGSGWYPTTQVVATGAEGADGGLAVLWTGVETWQETESGGPPVVQLSWAQRRDIDFEGDCAVEGEEGPLVVVEMNHIELYRGRQRSVNFTLPRSPGLETTYFFRVGVVSTGMISYFVSTSSVLAVMPGDPPLPNLSEPLHNASAGGCGQVELLKNQPPSVLQGYV